MAKQPENKKLKQFLEEIQEVSERYQYILTPVLQVGERGIMPSLKVQDRVPKKKDKKKK